MKYSSQNLQETSTYFIKENHPQKPFAGFVLEPWKWRVLDFLCWQAQENTSFDLGPWKMFPKLTDSTEIVGV